MGGQGFLRRISCGAISAFVIVSGGLLSAAERFEGDLELLKLAGEMQQANERKIQTWKGAVSYGRTQSGGIDGPQDAEREENTINFAFDRSLSAKTWRVRRSVRQTSDANGAGGSGGFEHFSAGLLKGRDLFTLGAEDAKTEHPYTWRLLENAKPDMRFYGSKPYAFDPFDYLEKAAPNTGLLEQYEHLKSTFENPAEDGSVGFHITVRREGDLIYLEHSLEHAGGGRSTRVYDLSQGGYPVRYMRSNTAAGSSARTSYEYEYMNGAWVPKRRTGVEIEPGGAEIRRETVFENLVVNEEIPEAEFSLEAVGAVEGDIVQDHRTKTSFVFGRALAESPFEAPAVPDIQGLIADLEYALAPAEAPADAEALPTPQMGAEPSDSSAPRNCRTFPAALAAAVLVLSAAFALAWIFSRGRRKT